MKTKTPVVCLVISVAWCVLLIGLLSWSRDLFQKFNFAMYDWKLCLTPLPDHGGEVVHLDVDDAAIEQAKDESGQRLGQWPWDRAASAKIVRRLAQFGAKVIVFDILYTSAARTQAGEQGDQEFFDAVKDAGNVVAATSGLSLTDEDTKELTIQGDRTRGDELYDKSWILHVPHSFRLWKVSVLKNSLMPLPAIIRAAEQIGHIQATPDSDGVYRRVALLVRLEGRCVPSLSLASLAAYWNVPPAQVKLNPQGWLEIVRREQPLKIPVDSRGMMLVRWGNIVQGFEHYTVLDVLSDEPDAARASRYRDKIVIVGVTHTGTTDMGVTPRSKSTPLSRIHSHALATMMTRSFIFSVPAFPWVVGLAVVVTVLFSVVAATWPWKVCAPAAVLICFLVLGGAILAFTLWSYDISVAEFFVVFVPPTLAAMGIRSAAIDRRAVRVARTMERYLDHEILDKILRSGAELDLSVKRTELSILFVDMQGFSTISETVGVEYVHRFLDDFFLRMTRVIFDHHGTVDKFLGDGLLAFFGDPVPLDNHAESAVRAAVDMQREMAKLNAEWSVSGISELRDGIHIRIGINTGVVIVGDLGSGRRVEYTVVGSAVNIASRLQSSAPPGGIMIAARTNAMIRDKIPCEGPDTIRVKGIDRDIEVYRMYPEAIAALPPL
jgi:adenylate cyclase